MSRERDIEAAVLAEREACAVIAIGHIDSCKVGEPGYDDCAGTIAAAIRARSAPRPESEREDFATWHSRNCPNVVMGVGGTSSCGSQGGKWSQVHTAMSHADAIRLRFFGRTCREVFESETAEGSHVAAPALRINHATGAKS